MIKNIPLKLILVSLLFSPFFLFGKSNIIDPPVRGKNIIYQWNSSFRTFDVSGPRQFTETQLEELNALAFDPINFRMYSNTKVFEVNKEIEITIEAELINISPNLIFTFEEMYGFSLKVLLPKGFIVTGGDYFDLISNRVSNVNPRFSYIIKGFFESETKECFRLLRSGYNANSNSLFVEKATICSEFLKANTFGDDNLDSSAIASTIQDLQTVTCSNLELTAGFFRWDTYPVSRKPKKASFTLGYRSSFGNLLRDITKVKDGYKIYQVKLNGSKIDIDTRVKTSIEYRTQISSGTDYNHPDDDGTGIFEVKSRFATILLEFDESITWNDGDRVIISNPNEDGIGVEVNRAVGADLNCSLTKIDYYGNQFNCSSDGIFKAAMPILSGNFKFCDNGATDITIQNSSGVYLNWSNNATTSHYTFIQPGSYWVKRTLQNSCESEKTYFTIQRKNSIDLKPNLRIVNTSDFINNILGRNKKVTLTSDCAGLNIQWMVNGEIAKGRTNPTESFYSKTNTTYSIFCSDINSPCPAQFESIYIGVSPTNECVKPELPIIAGSSLVEKGKEITLSVLNCDGGEIIWQDGSKGHTFKDTPAETTIYEATCFKNNCASDIKYFTVTVTIPSNAPSAPVISANATSVKPGTEVTLTATGCNSGTITWSNKDKGIKIIVSPSYTTSYYAYCTKDNKTSPNSNILNINVSGGCSEAEPPIISFSELEIIPGEYTNGYASGCLGKVMWYLDGKEFQGGLDLVTSLPGRYMAICENDCGNSIKSNEVDINLKALRIVHDIQDLKVYEQQIFTLEAVGCGEGAYVVWELTPANGGQKKYVNPVQVVGPGTYSARCVLFQDERKISQLVSVTFNLKSTDVPKLSATNLNCVFANQKVTLKAEGCVGAQIEWFDGGTSVGTSYRDVFPGSYWIRCRSGSQIGQTTSYTVCIKAPEPITITANKTEANFNEQILFQATGCDNGTILWIGPNTQSNWGPNVTMYGPGKYQARCYYNEFSFGDWVTINIVNKAPDQLTLISARQSVKEIEQNTITAIGCYNGTVAWLYVENGVEKTNTGRTIDVIGPGTYKAWCISLGKAGPVATITVLLTQGNSPTVLTDKSKARPTEPVKVYMSGCVNSGTWIRVTYPDGSQMVHYGSPTIIGPFKYEAGCVNQNTGQLVTNIFTGEVIPTGVDYIQVVSNKSRAAAEEEVVLSAYGCEFGKVEWRIGNTLISYENESVTTQSVFGNGYYYARCLNDPNRNEDWVRVYVEPAFAIGAIVSGPSKLCPGEVGYLLGSNCPSNYWMQWYLAEKGYVGGNNQEVRLPQTARVRCFKNDGSWASEWNELLIEPSFPLSFTARSNSPVQIGGDLMATVTDLNEPTAKFLWSLPENVSAPANIDLTQRTLVIPKMSSFMEGVYKVKVSVQGCAIEKEITIKSSGCDKIRIKAYVKETGVVTNNLVSNGISDGIRTYKPQMLSIETVDGNIVSGAVYTWTFPSNYPQSLAITNKFNQLVESNLVGKYKVSVKVATDICNVEVDLKGVQCNPASPSYTCGVAPSIIYPLNSGPSISNLAVGDVFTAGDYNVSVIKIESGNPENGWKGKGYINFNFMSATSSNSVPIGLEVDLKDVKVNDCYELTGGSVVSVYDPKWEGMVDLSNISIVSNKIKQLTTEVKELLKVYTGTSGQKASIVSKLNDISALKTDIEELNSILPSEITSLKSSITLFDSKVTCAINQPSADAGLRIGSQSEACSIADIELAETSLLTQLDKSNLLPEGNGTWWQNLCQNSFPSFKSVVGMDLSLDWGAGKLNELGSTNENKLIYAKGSSGRLMSNPPNGFIITYLGLWEGQGYTDLHYFQIVNTSNNEIFYLTQHFDGTQCPKYQIAKRSDWVLCDSKYPCPNLWTSVDMPFGAITKNEEVEKLANAYVGIVSSVVFAPALASAAAATAYSSLASSAYAILSKIAFYKGGDLIMSITISVVNCSNTDCTEEELTDAIARDFMIGKTIEGVALTFAEARIVSRFIISEIKANGTLNFLKSSIKEIKNKASSIWDDVFAFMKKSVQGAGKVLDDVVDEAEMLVLTKDIKYLPGPQLPSKISSTFEGSIYSNRKLVSNEKFYKYHGRNNRTGRKYAWYTNKKYTTELELRQKLAIRDDWGVQIELVTEFDVPSGTWVSEGKAAAQGVGYPGQDYQAVITNTPNSWIIKTIKAF
jgi:hypothetical protein